MLTLAMMRMLTRVLCKASVMSADSVEFKDTVSSFIQFMRVSVISEEMLYQIKV